MGKRELINRLEQLLRPYRKKILGAETPSEKPVKLLVERVLGELRPVFVEALAEGQAVHLTKIAKIRPKRLDDGTLTIACELKQSFVEEVLEGMGAR